MRHLVSRACASSSVALFALAMTLTGCDQLTPNGASDTMALLRSGSEKVCVAPDVQSTLKNILVPKADDVSDEASQEDKLAAIAQIKIDYELTTLQQFDKEVAKATCQTTVVITGVGDEPVKAQAIFQVAPAAENPSSFIVEAVDHQAQAYARMMISAAIRQATAKRAQQEADAQSAQAAAQQAQYDAQVRSIVSERWLTGVWLIGDADASKCMTSAAVRFQAAHTLVGGLGDGRWSLAGTELHLIGTRQGQQMDDRYNFTKADAFSAEAEMPDIDSSFFKLRRCTAAEMRSGSEPNSDPAVQVVSDQGAE